MQRNGEVDSRSRSFAGQSAEIVATKLWCGEVVRAWRMTEDAPGRVAWSFYVFTTDLHHPEPPLSHNQPLLLAHF